MKSNTPIYIGLAVLAFFVLDSFTNDDNSSNDTIADFSTLTNDESDLQRLDAVYEALQRNGFSGLGLKFAMAQILVESGILTNVANYHLMDDYHNYAGLTSVNGGYANYPNLDAFAHAYYGFLTKKSNPLGASSISDFNNRLVANHYYTDSPVTYGKNLAYYFNALNG